MELTAKIKDKIAQLPEEAQRELLEMIRELQQRYSTNPETPINNYENFKKIGLIGCCSTEQNLSTNYKQILAEEWTKKYDHR